MHIAKLIQFPHLAYFFTTLNKLSDVQSRYSQIYLTQINYKKKKETNPRLAKDTLSLSISKKFIIFPEQKGFEQLIQIAFSQEALL